MIERRLFLEMFAMTAAGLLVPDWLLDLPKGRSMVTVPGMWDPVQDFTAGTISGMWNPELVIPGIKEFSVAERSDGDILVMYTDDGEMATDDDRVRSAGINKMLDMVVERWQREKQMLAHYQRIPKAEREAMKARIKAP